MEILQKAIKKKICSFAELIDLTGINKTYMSTKYPDGFSKLEKTVIRSAINEIAMAKLATCKDLIKMSMTRKQVIENLATLAKKHNCTVYIMDDFSREKFIVEISKTTGYDGDIVWAAYIYDDNVELIYKPDKKAVGAYYFNELGKIFEYILNR